MELVWEEASQISSTELAYVEVRSALARAFRDGRLARASLTRARAELVLRLSMAYLVAPTKSLIRTAGELAERHRLRAYDAVHLASALSLGDPEVVLATWDRELRRAAGEAGFIVAS
jgi:uncharacterized protein